MINYFAPGECWLDTQGKPIQAHGGSVIIVDGTYYWYGEDKTFTDGKSGIWHNGVRCYSSKDLYNWTDEGSIIPASEDDSSPLYKKNCMDRPHIIYNAKTKKYVCWVKVMHKDGSQRSTVLTADNILGPYTIVTENLLPLGMSAGDFDLTVSEDGKAYYYFERVHSEMICVELTDDYTNVTDKFSRHFLHKGPPYVREAPAHFMRKDLHYLVTSGTTGYLPNPSEVAVAIGYHGEFEILGNPHIGDKSNTSFHSQISCVFKVKDKDLYIAMADRWVPDRLDLNYEDYKTLYEKVFIENDKNYLPELMKVGDDFHRNTQDSIYVWLPIKFVDGKPVIEWKDKWRWEECL